MSIPHIFFFSHLRVLSWRHWRNSNWERENMCNHNYEAESGITLNAWSDCMPGKSYGNTIWFIGKINSSYWSQHYQGSWWGYLNEQSSNGTYAMPNNFNMYWLDLELLLGEFNIRCDEWVFLSMLIRSIRNLTEHFTTIWPQNPSTGVSERHKVNPYLDIKAMKLRYVRPGLDD